MKIKKGAIMAGLKPVMRRVLILADEIWTKNGQELVVTSALDGTHSPGSLHYYGYALDFRIRYFDESTTHKVYNELKESLNMMELYDVVLHKTHIHVEYKGHPLC
jgi:hypothetical protein